MPDFLTTRQAASAISNDPTARGSVDEWQVRRLFEDGDLPEPQNFGGKRVINRDSLPEIIERLRARGWLPALEAVTA
jgi:hypothetical protein